MNKADYDSHLKWGFIEAVVTLKDESLVEETTKEEKATRKTKSKK